MTLSMGTLLSVLAAAIWGGLPSLLFRATLILAIGAGVCAILRHASAAIRHVVAMATLTALIGLPVASLFLPAVSLPILPAKSLSRAAFEEPTAKVGRHSSVALAPPRSDRVVGSRSPVAPTLSGTRIQELAILVWVLVSMAMLLHILVSLAAAWITARRARPIADRALRRDLDEARARLGVSRGVDLRESATIGVPVVWGFARPVLLLPVAARDWTQEQLRIVFLHEVAHVARHDGVGLLIARFATSLFWFHPLAWVLARIARRECERSCDDLVLAAGERATDYAERLLAIVRSIARPEPFAGVAPALAQRSNLETRLVSILRSDQRRGPVSRAGLFATIGSAAFVLIATAVVHVVAAEPGRLVDPKAMSASEEDRGSTVGWIKNQLPMEAPPYGETKEGERAFRAGQKATEEGSYVRAASSFLTAAATGHRFPESLYRAAGALAKAGAKDDAMKTLEVAIEAGFDGTDIASDPSLNDLKDDPRFTALLDQPMRITVQTVPVVVPPTYEVADKALWKSADLNQSGIALMRAGKYDQAIQAFEQEARESGSSNAMYNMACAYALRGDKRRAFDALERAIENGFDNSQHMVQDDDLQLIQGDPHFYELVRLAKDLQLFGASQLGFNGERDWQKSLSRFERVTKEHPDVGRAWANLGFARLEGGDPKGGAEAYQRALDLGYRGPTIMYNLACCAARSGEIDKAFHWLDQADKAGFEVGEHVGSDSDLDALRGDRRYDDLLQRWDQKMAKQHREKDKDRDKEKDKTY